MKPDARGIPKSYLGISTEYWSLPLYARQLALFEKMISRLRVPGGGPLVLRIGGDSADQAFWMARRRRVRPWMFELSPGWLKQTSELVADLRMRVIVDLNVITGSTSSAAAWARVVRQNLPPHALVGFEIGNEPDIYNHRSWLLRLLRGGVPALPQRLSLGTYLLRFHAFSRALHTAVPGAPLLAPALANVGFHSSWITGLIAAPHPGLRTVSAHWYPLDACARPWSSGYPTIARVLSDRSSGAMALSLARAVRLVHRAGLSFRLTELNSVTCGGRSGVSNTFATALWAPDALFELMKAGVDGVNVHLRAFPINAPFALGPQGVVARPFMYGLILFVRTLGADARLVSVRLHADPRLRLQAWAVRVRGGRLHMLLIDKSARGARVSLRLPAQGPATVQRLTAPSAGATVGVRLDGQEIGPGGAWRGTRVSETVLPVRGSYSVKLSPMSAALVDVRLRGALQRRR